MLFLKNSLTQIVIFIIGFSWLQACGTLVGNPKQPGDDNGKNTEVVWPEYNYSMPEDITSEAESASLTLTMAAPNQRFTVAHLWIQRIDNMIRKSERIIEQFSSEDRVSSFGRFKGRGSQKNIDLVVEEAGGDYQFEAVFCFGGTKFMELFWDEGGEKAKTIRQLSITPLDSKGKANDFAEFTIEKSEDGVTIDYYSVGSYKKSSVEGRSGTNIRSYSRYFRNAEGVITLQGVSDRFEDDPDQADTYLISQIVENEGGSFLAYNRDASRCEDKDFIDDGQNQFIEPVLADFCQGRLFGQAKELAVGEKLKEFAKLKSIQVPSQSNLKSVSFASELECPAE